MAEVPIHEDSGERNQRVVKKGCPKKAPSFFHCGISQTRYSFRSIFQLFFCAVNSPSGLESLTISRWNDLTIFSVAV